MSVATTDHHTLRGHSCVCGPGRASKRARAALYGQEEALVVGAQKALVGAAPEDKCLYRSQVNHYHRYILIIITAAAATAITSCNVMMMAAAAASVNHSVHSTVESASIYYVMIRKDFYDNWRANARQRARASSAAPMRARARSLRPAQSKPPS